MLHLSLLFNIFPFILMIASCYLCSTHKVINTLPAVDSRTPGNQCSESFILFNCRFELRMGETLSSGKQITLEVIDNMTYTSTVNSHRVFHQNSNFFKQALTTELLTKRVSHSHKMCLCLKHTLCRNDRY